MRNVDTKREKQQYFLCQVLNSINQSHQYQLQPSREKEIKVEIEKTKE
jgi:DUF1365 family protein